MNLRRFIRCAALLPALVLAALLVSSPAWPSDSHAKQAAGKPTIVLVHGAWADGSSWNSVAQRLQRDGYTVTVVANPLRGVASDSAYLADRLQVISGPFVLVGHSYGGAVVTNAAVGNPNVKALVYVDAFIPDAGESVIQLAGAKPGSQLGGDPRTVFDFAPYPGAPTGDFDLYVKPSVFVSGFGNDLPKRQAAVLAASQRPLTLSGGSEKSGTPAWKTIRSWAVIGTADRIIPPAEQLSMAQRAKAQITQIEAGHLSMISRPDAVEKAIVQAARAVA